MKVCFETFGCRLNKAEALSMEAAYLEKGWELTSCHADADLFVVRGCSVTARAQRDCEKLIEHLRRAYPATPLRVCGCLSQKKSSAAAQNAVYAAEAETTASAVPTRTAKAYLKVQDGCSCACTFCIVPQFRGASVSAPFAEVVDRARRFVDAGYHEIDVTGCNLAQYASDGRRLPDLVSALAEAVGPDCRLRLGSVEPGPCALETVAAMTERANVCRFLHIPVQSGSNRILKAMRRPYQVSDVEALVAEAVKRIPGLGLGCDVMTGFPDEGSGDFIATKGLLRRLPFNLAHVFPYSERPGTPAAAFGGAVPKPVRSSRAHDLARLVREKRQAFARRFLGRDVEVVAERETKTEGWTSEYLRCSSVMPVPRKSKILIHVTKIAGDALEGRVRLA